jgi:2-keto-myo-inositol isomerase
MSTMRLCLNAITIKQADLMTKIEAAAAAGFEGIGLWHDDVTHNVEGGTSLDAISDALQANGLIVPEMCYVAGWTCASGKELDDALSLADQRFEQASELGCDCVIAPAISSVGDLDRAAEDYARLCGIAEKYGITPAVEFIGMAQHFRDIAAAWEIVKRADHPLGSILLDTFHFYRGSSRIEDLRQIPGDKIALVHINDCVDKPLDQLADTDRVMPGDGVLPLPDILCALKAVGFEGHLSLELFADKYWGMDPFEAARIGYGKTKAVLDALA